MIKNLVLLQLIKKESVGGKTLILFFMWTQRLGKKMWKCLALYLLSFIFLLHRF